MTRAGATAVLLIGLACAAVGTAGVVVANSVFDRDQMVSAGAAVRSSPVVEAALRDQLALAVAQAFPPGTSLNPATVAAVVERVLADPAVTMLFDRQWAARVRTGGGAQPLELDGRTVGAAVARAISAVMPAVGRTARVDAPVRIDAELLALLPAWGDRLRGPAWALLVLGIALVLAGIVMAPMRGAAVARNGRWIVATAAGMLALGFAVSGICAAIGSGGLPTLGALVRASSDHLVAPLGVLLVGGVAVLGIGIAWQRSEERTRAAIPRHRVPART